jgi:hypothetical protein
LASGETQPEGWRWIVTLASIGGYTVALVVVGCAGALLMRDLFTAGKRDRGRVRPGA